MFKKDGLLQPQFWRVRVGPTRKGGLSWQSTGVPRVGCSLGSPGLDLLLQPLVGIDTHTSSHFTLYDKSSKWAAMQPAAA